MGLREDFRSALGAIATAIPEAVRSMRHGELESGEIVQATSRDFAESVSEIAPGEQARFVANAADFPTLEVGSAVEIEGGSLRAVTSLKYDPVGATLSFGLSAEFEKCPAAYSGTRREAGAVRQIKHPLDVLLLENGQADTFADALAPSYATAYLVAVRLTDWPEVTEPEPSDVLEVAPGGHPFALKVSTVTRHDGWYILKCRTRG